MSQPVAPEKLVITVAAGYKEEQIRPFIASLRRFSPSASLRLIVGRRNSEFEAAIRAWFPACEFFLLPSLPLRDFALKRKWARSILKRVARWSGSREFGKRLLKINFLRHGVILALLADPSLDQANVLLTDCRDVVFQGDPFSVEWPLLWTCEEDRRIGECSFNSIGIKRTGGETAFEQTKDCKIVCAGVIGGRVDRIRHYLQQSSRLIEQLTPRIVLTDGGQGIHNYLVRLKPQLGFTVLPNGCPVANLGYTNPADLTIRNGLVSLRTASALPAVLHQYDRHPNLTTLAKSRWANAPLPT